MNDINYEKLRSDLINYYGTAIAYNPMAIVELSEVKCASNEKLIQIARKNGFSLENYEKGKVKRY